MPAMPLSPKKSLITIKQDQAIKSIPNTITRSSVYPAGKLPGVINLLLFFLSESQKPETAQSKKPTSETEAD